jgi:hypothetical protein
MQESAAAREYRTAVRRFALANRVETPYLVFDRVM